MAVNQVAKGSGLLATPSKVLGSTPLVDLATKAFVRCGLSDQQAASALRTSTPNFSKAFSVNWPENNPFMKKWDELDFEIRLEFAKLIAADYGVTSLDSDQTRTLRDFARLIKAVNE